MVSSRRPSLNSWNLLIAKTLIQWVLKIKFSTKHAFYINTNLYLKFTKRRVKTFESNFLVTSVISVYWLMCIKLCNFHCAFGCKVFSAYHVINGCRSAVILYLCFLNSSPFYMLLGGASRNFGKWLEVCTFRMLTEMGPYPTPLEFGAKNVHFTVFYRAIKLC